MEKISYSSFDTRIRAIKSLLANASVCGLAKAYNVNRTTIFRWRKRFESKKRFEDLKRVLGSGKPRLIDETYVDKMKEFILKPASEFGYETDFWTCRRMMQIFKKKFKINVSQPTMWRVLRRANLTYQKPERRYFESSDLVRKKWLRYDVPKIRKAVKKHRAILYFQDESNISLTSVLGKTWAPRGKTPIQKVTGKRGGVAAMSAISGAGSLIFSLYEKRIASPEIIQFLEQMLKHHKRRHLVVVMDRAPCHTSKITQQFINNQKRLHVFYLPSYSPDWNPDEKVWAHLKHEELKSHNAKTKKQLKSLARRKLNKMSKNQTLLRGIFFRCHVAHLMN